MIDSTLRILDGTQIQSILSGREKEIIQAVKEAYQTHDCGDSSLPYSVFLRFPNKANDRIIGLPAFIGGDKPVAGMKWIASFPDNIKHGMERASALLILNSLIHGRPEAVLESSLISAKRTAASAALSVRYLSVKETLETMAVIGCGPIGFETVKFIQAEMGQTPHLYLFDLDRDRAEYFADRCRAQLGVSRITISENVADAARCAEVVAFTTSAGTPHVESLDGFLDTSVVLHLSLRDLSAQAILGCDNIVDDVDHVCRAQTSVHLAELKSGDRSHVRGSLAQVINGTISARRSAHKPVVFSPFGLGILDLAVGQLVLEKARQGNVGIQYGSFFPDAWDSGRSRG